MLHLTPDQNTISRQSFTAASYYRIATPCLLPAALAGYSDPFGGSTKLKPDPLTNPARYFSF